jgi:hypothetical protein
LIYAVSRDNAASHEEAINASSERAVKRRTETAASSKEDEAYEATPAQDQSVSTKAKEAGRSLKDLASSASRKTRAVVEEKAGKIKTHSVDLNAALDAKDIRNLGSYTNKLSAEFEEAIVEIRKEPYGNQAKLLASYKKLLEGQLAVVETRLNLASRLKPGS